MIDEDSDDSHDFIISSDSPEAIDISHESNIVWDPSSPFKNEPDKIIEVISPEINKAKQTKINKNRSIRKTEKKTIVKRRLLNTRPALSFTISKRTASVVLDKDDLLGITTVSPPMQICYNARSTREASPVAGCSGISKVNSLSHSLVNKRIIKPVKPKIIGSTLLVSKEETILPQGDENDINLTDSFSEKMNTTLNSSFDDREDERIIDTSSQLFQIDVSQDTIVDDDEPIDNSPSTSKVQLIEHFSERTREYIGDGEDAGQSTDLVLQHKSLAPTVKVPKKGTLLDRGCYVIAKTNKNFILYSHELAVGLRTSRGPLVSDILVVKSVRSEKTSFFVECTPFFSDSQEHHAPRPFRTFLYSTKLSSDVCVNTELVIHFPVLAMFDIALKIIVVFVDNKVQILSKGSCTSELTGDQMPLDNTDKKSIQIFRYMKSRAGKNILDSVCCNSLIVNSVLELDVLQIYEDREKNLITLLTKDSEQIFCMVYLKNSEKTNDGTNIQTDSIYTFTGFHLTKCFEFNSKMKQTVEYYACSPVEPANKYMYIFETFFQDFKINFLRNSGPRSRSSFSINPQDNPFPYDEVMW